MQTVIKFDFQGLEYFEGGGDNNTAYPRYVHFEGSVSVSSQPSLSGASSDSFDVDRSSSNDGKICDPFSFVL